jgi:hypothetical protein
MAVIKDSEIAWMAGLLEGEGSFTSRNPKSKGRIYPYPAIVVRMTDQEPIQRIANLFGTRISRRKDLPSGKPLYQATACSAKAAGWMMTLWVEMSPRRRQQIKNSLTAWTRRLWTGANIASRVPQDQFYTYEKNYRRTRDNLGRFNSQPVGQ